ncbi:hypothetical protein VTL71DRAFT_4175 [Oculimacula yallundae]|uniref:Uncharacterized protein n=1 Tax=Oculimacula yallundae TaxID=86028 RepID=A0ABR4C5T7_9HELO
MAMRGTPPTSPPSANYSHFGGRRHGFNSGSYYGRTLGGLSQAIRLPPITAMFTRDDSLRSSPVRTVYGINMGMRNAGLEDIDMTTPDLLQRPSHYDGDMSGDRATTPQPPICSCRRDETVSPRPLLPLEDPCILAHPYARWPVDDVLNHSPPPGTQAQTGAASTIPDAGRSDTDHPMITPPSSSSAPSNKSTSPASSISSDSTQRPPYNATEQRCYILNTLYHICMDATKSYLNNLPFATRNRHNQLPRHRCYGSRYHPYLSPPRSNRSEDDHERRRTLMDNISSISTHIWRRARSDEMAPHRAEGDAVHSMAELYEWSEVVVRGMESDGVDIEREDGVFESPGEIRGMKVACAAEMLCRWLGDEQAREDCEVMGRELEGLIEAVAEVAGVRITEVDEESLDGNIT